jgi:hypothetical protein
MFLFSLKLNTSRKSKERFAETTDYNAMKQLLEIPKTI